MQPWALEVIEQIDALQDSVQTELDKVTAAETLAIESLTQGRDAAGLASEPEDDDGLLSLGALQGRSLSELEDIRRVFTDTLRTLQAAKDVRAPLPLRPRAAACLTERPTGPAHVTSMSIPSPLRRGHAPQYLIRGKFESQDSGLRAVDEIFENLSQRVRPRLFFSTAQLLLGAARPPGRAWPREPPSN